MTNPNIFTFSHALILATKGIPVSPSTGDFIDRLTGIAETKMVEADQIWSPENRRIGSLIAGPKGLIPVAPYTTMFTRAGIVNYIPTNIDMHTEWMNSSYANRCVNVKFDVEDSDDFCLEFERIEADQHLKHHLPFWMLYDQDMIGYHQNAIFIAGNVRANRINSVIHSMLATAIDIRDHQNYNDGFVVNDWETNDEWEDYCHQDTSEYQHLTITPTVFDIEEYLPDADSPVNVFVDVDSLNELNLFNGENALEYIKGFLEQMRETHPLLNWVSFSLKEEIENSNDRRKVETEAAGDETYALKA